MRLVRFTFFIWIFLFGLHSYAEGLSHLEVETEVNHFTDAFADSVALHGAQLSPLVMWEVEELNAYARQTVEDGVNHWWILVYGGFAKHPRLTLEGLDFALCHELGHHLAGYPFNPGSTWMSTEGEADYFASQACLRKLWSNQIEANAKFRKGVPVVVKKECNRAWKSFSDQNLCYRINRAAMDELTMQDQTRKTPPRYDVFDPTVVPKTLGYSHPPAQCRVDTILNASLCETNFDFSIIPGLNLPAGLNSVSSQEVAMKNSCVHSRPACWFKELN